MSVGPNLSQNSRADYLFRPAIRGFTEELSLNKATLAAREPKTIQSPEEEEALKQIQADSDEKRRAADVYTQFYRLLASSPYFDPHTGFCEFRVFVISLISRVPRLTH